MARTTKPLTNTEIAKAKPKNKEYNLADGKGLSLRVKPNGSKLWLFNYAKPFSKKRANLSLGLYPTLSLKSARAKRQEYLELLQQEIDPKTHRTTEAQKAKAQISNTLELVASQWMEVKRSQVTADYAKDIWRSFELHLFPQLGKIPISRIKAPDAIQILKPIASKGSLETVKRLCQRINEVMTHAVNTGVIESNPLAGINKAFQAPQKQNMPTLKPEELPRLMVSLSQASIRRITRLLVEWQLHTMVRPSEAAGARWDEIDLDKELWQIPAERMKKRRSHTIPLSPQALTLLDQLKPFRGNSEYLFPADRNWKNHTHPQTVNMALKRMGFGGELVSHGLRALASTTLNEQGFDPDIIESALAHYDSNEVRAAYNRAEYLERRRTMMAWWSNHIEEAATGSVSLASSRKGLKLAASK